ncbi:hypothetical protein FMUND_7416 [Fusarium mundagurra]|uniref:Uncharacterized protein n=1 Tax=Fusarium mundagurra TaxID=1567541 RepID=A0A8H5YLR6_9HYPO|nr:hypothetical protein FMUND_7416 [Fusarium mundagurra]
MPRSNRGRRQQRDRRPDYQHRRPQRQDNSRATENHQDNVVHSRNMNQTSNQPPSAAGVHPLNTFARRAYLQAHLQYHRVWDEATWVELTTDAEDLLCKTLAKMGYRSIPLVFFDHAVDEHVWEQYIARMRFTDPDEHCWPWGIRPDPKNMAGGICHFYKNWREERGLLVDGPDAQTPTIDKPAASRQLPDAVDTMVLVKDEVASEAGLPTPLPSALQPTLEAQINERPSDFIKQERKITAEQERKINALQTKVDALEMKLVDKQRQIDLLRTAPSSSK